MLTACPNVWQRASIGKPPRRQPWTDGLAQISPHSGRGWPSVGQQCGHELLAPVVDVILRNDLEQRFMALAPLLKRHVERPVDRVANGFRIVGIDQEGGVQFRSSAREA